MLTRVHIDNFRCFVNFDFRPEAKQLILGLNGGGKSAFFDVLRGIREFAVVGCKVDQVFNADNRTRWQTLPRQTFELEVNGNEGVYLYTLWVDADDSRPRSRVIKESLDFNSKPLILFQDDHIQLFDEDRGKAASYPFEPDRSAISVTGPRKASPKL